MLCSNALTWLVDDFFTLFINTRCFEFGVYGRRAVCFQCGLLCVFAMFMSCGLGDKCRMEGRAVGGRGDGALESD